MKKIITHQVTVSPLKKYIWAIYISLFFNIGVFSFVWYTPDPVDSIHLPIQTGCLFSALFNAILCIIMFNAPKCKFTLAREWSFFLVCISFLSVFQYLPYFISCSSYTDCEFDISYFIPKTYPEISHQPPLIYLSLVISAAAAVFTGKFYADNFIKTLSKVSS